MGGLSTSLKIHLSKFRPSTTIRTDSSAVARNQQPGTKRKKMEQEQPSSGKAKMATEKMIELEFVSSDEEF